MFGLQLVPRRFSTASHLQGSKLTQQDMTRTQSLKLRRVNQIKSSRTRLPEYEPRHVYRLAQDGEPEATALFFSHTKVLRGPQRKRSSYVSHGLMVEPSQAQKSKEQEETDKKDKEKDKIYFYSANLDQNANLYMNRLLNKSEHQRKEKLRQIEENLQLANLSKVNSSKTQNHFWRKMRKSLSKRGDERESADPSKTTRYT